MNEKNVKLFPSQIKALTSKEKIILLLCSRSYGKSYSVAYWCILKLLQDSYRGILVNASFQQLRETIKYVLQHLEFLGIPYAINTRPSFCHSLLSDHKNIISIDVGDGKHHYLKTISFDNKESIRGSSCDFFAIDEAALCDEEYFDIALPTLRGNPLGKNFNYQILLATTPTTVNNWIYKRFIDKTIPNFIEIKGKAHENFIEFDEAKIQYLKDSMTELMYSREYDLQWLSMSSNTMAYAFHDGLISSEDHSKDRLFMSCDINNIDLQTICGYFSSNHLNINGEITIHEGGNPFKIAQAFHKIYSHLPNRQVVIFGDRMGNNRSTVAKDTYYDQLKKSLKDLGWVSHDKTNDFNSSVWDSNELFMKLCEKNQFSINPNCKEIIRHLKTCQWKENEHVMDKKLLDSGFYDAIRYVCWQQFRPGQTMSSMKNPFKL